MAISDADWRYVIRRHRVVASLPLSRSDALRAMATRFLATKSIEPVQGLALDAAARAAKSVSGS